jgi:hypothetical protein
MLIGDQHPLFRNIAFRRQLRDAHKASRPPLPRRQIDESNLRLAGNQSGVATIQVPVESNRHSALQYRLLRACSQRENLAYK